MPRVQMHGYSTHVIKCLITALAQLVAGDCGHQPNDADLSSLPFLGLALTQALHCIA